MTLARSIYVRLEETNLLLLRSCEIMPDMMQATECMIRCQSWAIGYENRVAEGMLISKLVILCRTSTVGEWTKPTKEACTVSHTQQHLAQSAPELNKFSRLKEKEIRQRCLDVLRSNSIVKSFTLRQ